MRMILLGPPGSGKGTQAKLLSERLDLIHIGTGDIIREAMRTGTPHGEEARPYLDRGDLVPDALVNELVFDVFRREDRPQRFVMDGYPRTLPQATAFHDVLTQHQLPLDAVVFVKVNDERIVSRLSGRWSCPKCKRTYHLVNNPPRQSGVCDRCGGTLYQRPDDREETVRARLTAYHKNTVDLVPYYQAKGILHGISGEGDIEEVYKRITQALNL